MSDTKNSMKNLLIFTYYLLIAVNAKADSLKLALEDLCKTRRRG